MSVRVIQDRTAAVRMELLRRLRDEHATNATVAPRRTVADLLDSAAHVASSWDTSPRRWGDGAGGVGEVGG